MGNTTIEKQIDTKLWIDRYFESRKSSTISRNKSVIDRPELYNYEAEIGKSVLQMNVDELIGFLLKYRTVYGKVRPVRQRTVHQVTSIFRDFFDYYINHEEGQIIINPWSDHRLRGTRLVEKLAEGNTFNKDSKVFNKAEMDKIIKELYANFHMERAKYIECIMQLYYCGFSNAQEIVLFKYGSIREVDPHKIAVVNGHVVRLNDKCIKLLDEVHGFTVMPLDAPFDAVMQSWNNSYLKMPIAAKEADAFDNRDINLVAGRITSALREYVCKRLGHDVNYRSIYMLGFYDYLEQKYGKDRTQRLIMNHRNDEDVQTLKAEASKYGLHMQNISHIKRALMDFVSVE